MAKTKVIKPFFPSKIYVYPCDYDNGEPIFAVETSLDNCDTGDVAQYELKVFGVVERETVLNIKKRKVVK